MNPGMIAAIAYGALAIIGGIMGYAQAQSKMSLISGGISGVLLIIGGVLQLQGQSGGLILATVVTAVLILVFGIRLAKTRKFMPAGLMMLLGVPALAAMINQLVAIR
jgi:uncharacterized membrane protein (UPF0136 family)